MEKKLEIRYIKKGYNPYYYEGKGRVIWAREIPLIYKKIEHLLSNTIKKPFIILEDGEPLICTCCNGYSSYSVIFDAIECSKEDIDKYGDLYIPNTGQWALTSSLEKGSYKYKKRAVYYEGKSNVIQLYEAKNKLKDLFVPIERLNLQYRDDYAGCFNLKNINSIPYKGSKFINFCKENDISFPELEIYFPKEWTLLDGHILNPNNIKDLANLIVKYMFYHIYSQNGYICIDGSPKWFKNRGMFYNLAEDMGYGYFAIDKQIKKALNKSISVYLYEILRLEKNILGEIDSIYKEMSF